jgi:thioredoxin
MMRKYILVLAMVSVAIAGCGNSGGSSEASATNMSAVNEPAVSETKATAKTTATEGTTINLTKADFLNRVMDYESNPTEWIYKGDKPAIIDFYADWCGPCKIAAPILEELAAEYKGEIYVYKVDTEVERELSSVFGIRSIPAFLFIPEEGKPTMSNGIARTPEETKQMFVQMIDELLLGKGDAEAL